MVPPLRGVTLLACLALVLAACVGGPGTGALLSDAHVVAGSVSADGDVDRVTTVSAIGEPDNSSQNTSTGTVTNETALNETTTNETAETSNDSSDDSDEEDGEDAQSTTTDESKADEEG